MLRILVTRPYDVFKTIGPSPHAPYLRNILELQLVAMMTTAAELTHLGCVPARGDLVTDMCLL